ncbi:MAG: hypothetical protein F4W96_04340 [Chloroflexi bacterium]|nr:hypothetical protein [Chloroflexota bacterium]
MADRYTISFSVLGDRTDPDLAALDLLDSVRQVVHEWVMGRFRGPTPDARVGQWSGNEESLKLQDDALNGSGYFVAEWEHPDRDDRQFRWRVTSQAATTDETVTFRANVQMIDSRTAITPDRRPVDRPRLIPEPIKRFECRLDGHPLSVTPAQVNSDNVTGFVKDVILSHERRLPIVVLSQTDDGQTALDPGTLQDRLAGLATVAVLQPQATWELTDLLGRHLTCFRGAVRIYWPGCQPEDISYRHRRWLFEHAQLLGKRLPNTLLHVLTTQFPRYAGQSTIDRVTRDIRHRRLHELDAAFRSLPAYGQIPPEIIPHIDAALSQRDETIEELRFEMEVRDETIREQTAELETHRRNYRDTSVQADSPVGDAEGMVIDSMETAVLSAADHLHRVRLLPTAFTSAENSPYEHPGRVYGALSTLNDLGDLLASGQSLGTGIAEHLRQRNVDYVGGESQTTAGRFGDERAFLDGDTHRSMTAHLRFGTSGDPRHCARVYLEWDDEVKEWIVGHVGRHLTNTRS